MRRRCGGALWWLARQSAQDSRNTTAIGKSGQVGTQGIAERPASDRLEEAKGVGWKWAGGQLGGAVHYLAGRAPLV